MDEVLFRALRDAAGEYLEAVDRAARSTDYATVMGVVRTETRRLVAAWRALLGLHDPAGRQRCPGCGHPPWRRRTMCATWRVANAYFVARLPGERERLT